jgi:hypothetical protein
MKSIHCLPVLAVLTVSFLAGKANAQFQTFYGYAPQSRVSPYLNLLRQGSAPGVNYYGLVRPEFEFRRNIGALQGQVLNNQQAITGLQTAPATAVTTGHAVGFQNHGSYFQSLASPGAFAFTAAGTTQPRAGTGAAGAGAGTGRPAAPSRGGR